jgi:uncharacterized membrane protein
VARARTPAASGNGAPSPHASGGAAGRPPARLNSLDAARGLALWAMVVYHFCFDLQLFGLLRADFYNDRFWSGTRTLILGAFLLIVGISLRCARDRTDFDTRFWRRVALVAGCALAVSAGSYLVFPRSYIHFGVLHAIAFASVLALAFLSRPRLAAWVGLALVAAGNTVQHPIFDTRWLNWIGLVTRKPPTEDYVPLLPWLGVVLLGIALADWVLSRPRPWLERLDRVAPRILTLPGRHSLVVYMLHQPLLIGALWVATRA